MNIARKILLSKKFHLIILAILAITSLIEVIRDISSLHSWRDIGAHHGIVVYAMATFAKECWEIIETKDKLANEDN